MTKENKNQIEKTITRFKENVDKNGVPIKVDILSLQGYKDYMSRLYMDHIIPIYQRSMPSIATSTHWELSIPYLVYGP